LLDGALGTMIQSYGLDEDDFRGRRFADKAVQLSGDNDVLNLTRPDIIRDIHCRYLEAGADLITTNTFSSQRVSQTEYQLTGEAAEMALAGALLARECADAFSTEEHPRYVCGSVGPTGKTCSISPDVTDMAARDITYDELFDAYREEIRQLIRGGVDAILVETIFDTLNAKAAIDAALTEFRQEGRELPLMLSVTVSDKSGRTLSGQTLDAFLATVSAYPIFSVGLNCSLGAREMRPFLSQLADKAPCFVSLYPNAGLPNELGQYDDTPGSMSTEMAWYAREGLVNIIGGCCGTTDAFIARFRDIADAFAPRKVRPRLETLCLSGLERLDLTPEVRFVNVGERCNVAGSRKFLRLIQEKKYDEALVIARRQVEDGALVLDINMDDGLLDAPQEMAHFLKMMAVDPDIARVPVMIDSSDWQVILAGLKCVQGKCIVNSISLKEGEETFLRHARDVRRFGAAVVVMCFDEEGQAVTYERRIAIAGRSYRLLTEKAGFHPEDIIIDPNVLAIATGMEEHDAYALDFIRAVEWIKTNLPGAHVSGGVSNLSFAFRGQNYIREAMHAVFLYHAIAKGMDFGIVNPAAKTVYSDIPQEELQVIEDAVLCRDTGAAERLLALSERLRLHWEQEKAAGTVRQDVQPAWRQADVTARLVYAVTKGIPDFLENDLDEALPHYEKAVDIIEGPLMRAMNEVGDLFGEGKMFLPQVVKTARTMKRAVEILQPVMERERQGKTVRQATVILATVKGDVHDIGKNIVAVVLGCNNFEVVDLGVMVPADGIVRAAVENGADFVGLSGLITPSLDEMVRVARAMQEAGLRIPLIIGGATTSEMHVALKIAPVYDGPVFWVKDAAQDIVVASRWLTQDRNSIAQSLRERYRKMRGMYEQNKQNTELRDLSAARENKLDLW